MTEGKGADLKCPKCGAQFPLSEAVKDRVREETRAELAAETERFRREAEAKARESLGLELADQKDRVKDLQEKLTASQAAELELRKRERSIDDRERAFELMVERRLSEGKKTIEEAAAKRAEETHRLKDAEAEKQIQDLRDQLSTALRRSEQGSQQLQGEVLELDLESLLGRTFASDEIVPVPKGFRGGDVLQRVRNPRGTLCGTVLWETKTAKDWSDKWIEKLREDQRRDNLDLAAIVSEVLPKGCQNFGLRDGVWVTNRSCVIPVAIALREMLIQVGLARVATANKDKISEELFSYMTEGKFSRRIEEVVQTIMTMRDGLEEQKRRTAVLWAKQETALNNAIMATAGMYGDLRGLAGPIIQEVPLLEERTSAGPSSSIAGKSDESNKGTTPTLGAPAAGHRSRDS